MISTLSKSLKASATSESILVDSFRDLIETTDVFLDEEVGRPASRPGLGRVLLDVADILLLC